MYEDISKNVFYNKKKFLLLNSIKLYNMFLKMKKEYNFIIINYILII